MSTAEQIYMTSENYTKLMDYIKYVEEDTAIIHDYVWLLSSSFLVLTMQAGFALYESSLVRGKNMHNVLLKNVMDGCIGAVFWLLFGYGLAFGPGNGFVGTDYFLGLNITGKDFAFFLFQYSFAATASTIMSGALAERVSFYGYMVMCGFINSINYAFVAHWVWHPDGWLYKWGFYDFAGCGVVHIVGGCAGLVSAIYVGPRIGKFTIDENGKKVSKPMPMAQPGLAILGVFILCWGWFGFNGGSTLKVSHGWYNVVGLVCLNTAFASSSGAIGALFFSMWVNRKEHFVDVLDVANGILAGLIGITASASVVSFWEAVFIGVASSWAVLGAQRLIEKYQFVDDPVGAFPMHGIGGVCGLIWVGLFARGPMLQEYIGDSAPTSVGLFYGGLAGLEQLGKQIAGMIVIALWSCSFTLALCFIVDKFIIKLRVSPEAEKLGMDLVEHRIGYTKPGKFVFSASLDEEVRIGGARQDVVNKLEEQLEYGFTKIDLPTKFTPSKV